MVQSSHDTEDLGFDLQTACQSAKVYGNSVDVQTIVIDKYGHTLYDSQNSNGRCAFCHKLQSVLGYAQQCQNVHLYGSYQAERFGGSYVFFCPMGLTHWASPISAQGIMQGAMVAGPVLMIDKEEFVKEDLAQRFQLTEPQIAELQEYVERIPYMSPDKVNNISEMLFVTASFVTNASSSSYLEDRELYRQQSDISEYIKYIKTMGGSERTFNDYPIDKEKELLYLISIGDKHGSQKILNEIFGHVFFSSGRNFDIIKARVLEIIVLLSRAALEGGADVEQIFGLNYKYLNEIHDFKTIEELTYWLSSIMARFTDCVFNLADVKHVDVIYKAVDFIKRNYMKKITLEDVASHVYLSPSYFSKIFKEEMKSNFNTYLNQVRIEMSKKLLGDDSIDLVDVSSLVGFEDQSYFCKVFKKITGYSPGKYRDMRRT